MPTSTHRFLVNASWLIKLRWVAVVGQLITIAGVAVCFQLKLNYWPLAVVIGLTALSNLVLTVWFSRVESGTPNSALSENTWNIILGLVMTMDMLSLTALLYATGGPTNPFCLFFFVNLSLCAVVLDRRWAWGLNALTIACFAWLLFDHRQIADLDLGMAMLPVRQTGSWSIAQAGLMVAFMTCASVIVYFMTRLTGELRMQELNLRVAQHQQARSEKIEALGTLAAGAAHELATPLSTIAVVARDVEKAIEKVLAADSSHADLVEDIHLVRSELDRCRKILDRMAGHAGEAVGESIRSVTVRQLWHEIADGIPSGEQVRVQIAPNLDREKLEVPLAALSQALRGLVQNAIDASLNAQPVEVAVTRKGNLSVWTIRDRGPGMSASVLDRVSEPFFTTKQPGKGMGLGVFLAKNVVQRLGGTIQYQSRPRQGTIVTILLPLSVETEH